MKLGGLATSKLLWEKETSKEKYSTLIMVYILANEHTVQRVEPSSTTISTIWYFFKFEIQPSIYS